MKISTALTVLGFCVSLNALNAAQVAKESDQDYSKFLIDVSKPYVYLEVDHVGPRKPLRNDEPSTGLWLRLKNNCKLPIVVVSVRGSPQSPKEPLTLEDEVIPNRQIVGEDARMAGIFSPRGFEKMLEKMDDIIRFPNMTEEEVRSAEAIQRGSNKPLQRPLGYGLDSGFDTLTLTLVPAGGEVLFSVPSNHVSQTWHFEIPFRLAVPNNSRIRPPYSYVAFYQDDLDRAQEKADTPTTR